MKIEYTPDEMDELKAIVQQGDTDRLVQFMDAKFEALNPKPAAEAFKADGVEIDNPKSKAAKT